MDLEKYSLARNFVIYCDGITDCSHVAETMAKEYGLRFQVPTPTKDIEKVNDAIKKAGETLQRKLSHPIVYLQSLQWNNGDYLQRNYRLIAKGRTIFAFGHLERDCQSLRGGTGWSVQMAVDMEKDVFVYDIESSTWF